MRALAVLSGAVIAAVITACDGGASEPPFLVEISPLPTATATPTAERTPTVVPTPTTAPEAAPSRIFFRRETQLWSINRDGSDPLLLSAEGLGYDSPLPSPQRDKVAFIGTGGNLWVIDSNGNNLKRLSEEAFPADETYTTTYVLISGWSPDATKIIYAVRSGGIGGGSEEVRPEVGLGFHLVDLDTGKKTKLPLLQNFVAWSTDPETVIYEQEEGERTDWYTFNLGTGATSKLTAVPFQCFSILASLFSDGNRLLYSCGNIDDYTSRIMIANIDNTNQRVLLAGQWAELQSPVFSPSAEGFIYEHQFHQPGAQVIIDLQFFDLETGEQTLLASGFVKLKGWVDDRSALVLETEEFHLEGLSTLYLVDVATGAKTKLADDVTFR